MVLPMCTVGSVFRSRLNGAVVQLAMTRDAAPTLESDISYHVAADWAAWPCWFAAAIPAARSVSSRARAKWGICP